MGCWCSLELSGGRFNDGMAPVSMDMEGVGGGGESGRWKCGGGNEMFGGHRCYSRKLNEKDLEASPGEVLFDHMRDGGTVYRVCLVSPRNASTGGRIRGWRGGRRAPGRPSIPIECGLARTVRWSTRVGCPRRAPPERPGRSSGQGGRGRERFAQSSITYAQFCENEFGTDMHPTVHVPARIWRAISP